MTQPTITTEQATDAAPMPPHKAAQPIPISDNGMEVLRRRYLRRGPDGKPMETVPEMFWRVASHVALPERAWGSEEDYLRRAEQFYDLMTTLRFFPNSPTFTGAGTPLGQLAACFVLAIDDDMGKDSPEGIFNTLRNAALIQQTGGGNGFSFSRLRPKGDQVNSSAGVASGPVGFLRVFDAAFGEIAQGGTRRGANMGVLRVDHPDIEEFIAAKAQEGQIANFNISVGATDAFMQAVKEDRDFDLINPRTGQVVRTVRARELFNKIIHYAHRNGEPGILFLDAANRSNPVPHLYQLEATNPCVTGDTLIYTDRGLRRADELAAEGTPVRVAVDARFGTEPLLPATHVFPTGVKPVYRLSTVEGYELRLTEDHKVMTTRGWVEVAHLRPGDRVHLLNRKGGFGVGGTLEEGRVLGWLVGDGTVNVVRAVLSFFGEEKRELAPLFAGMVNDIVERPDRRRSYPVGVVHVEARDEARVSSDRLRAFAEQHGLADNKFQVPPAVFAGNEAMQRGFLQALFTADGQVNDGDIKGCSVRLSSSHLPLLKDVQRLLLNFGIASTLYENRRPAGYRPLPDGRGGRKDYFCQAQHELAISKSNLAVFASEIGFLSKAKQDRLVAYLGRKTRGPYEETFLATVRSVEPDGVETVYDLHQPDTHSFIANGLVVHNCGEQWLGPYENCCLGSINLAQHLTADGGIDWAKLQETVELSTRFLDDVVSANKYVPAVPQLQEAAHRVRRIGLGIMGLADAMYHLGVRYGDRQSLDLAGQIMEFVRYHAMRTSIELAKERGPFPAIRGSIYDPEDLKWQPPTPLFPYQHDFGRPPLDWDAIVQGIKAHGIRNGAQTTIAPTGTIGTVTGCEGYGCEPVFALAYTRYVKEAGGDVPLTYISPSFLRALEAAGIEGDRRQRIIDEILLTGTCQGVEDLPQPLRHTFVVSQDITPTEHVLMQAALQRFVDNSISKCVTGDTLVLTPTGLVPIASLADFRLPDQFTPLDLAVMTSAGVQKADAFYYGGYRETRRVRLDYGFTIEGTPNHRVHVLDQQGKVIFRRLDEIKIGDLVVLYGGQNAFGVPGAALPAFSGEFCTSSDRISFPTRMSSDLAFLLGCIASEGSITANGVNIANTDRQLLENLERIAREQFDLPGHIAKDTRNEVHYLQLNSRALRHWLLVDLGLQAGAEHKVIPPCILQASRDEVAAFLRGLLLDGYMTQDGELFGITLASQALISQLQALLLNAGILATVRQTTDRAWNLTVQGGELERLIEWISFVEVWKNERQARVNLGRLHKVRNYSRLLPEEMTQALREMGESAPVALRAAYDVERPEEERAYQRARVNLNAGHRLDRSDAHRIYRALRQGGAAHPVADTFFAHDDEAKIYVRVQGIESNYAEVFDLSVPTAHEFIANGLCNHNTCNFPSTATPDDVAAAYMLAWELGCKGLTVYVTGSRQEVVLETKAVAEAKKGQTGSHTANGTGSTTDSVADAHPDPAALVAPSRPEPNGAAHKDEGVLPIDYDVKRPRPRRLRGATYRRLTPLGTAYVTVNETDEGEPFEVFLNVGKAGSDVAAVSEALGRLISLILRMPSSVTPTERLRQVVYQLNGIGGGRHLGFGPQRVRSLPDAIAQVLSEHLDTMTVHHEETVAVPAEQLALPISKPIGDLCPECGNSALLNVEGCVKCQVCGYSEC